MNSLKTTLVCVILLGVLYGMYQVINTPAPTVLDEEPPMVENLGAPVDPSQLDLLKDDPNFSMDEAVAQSDPTRSSGFDPNQYESPSPSPGRFASQPTMPSQSSMPSTSPTDLAATSPRLGTPGTGLAAPTQGGLTMPGGRSTEAPNGYAPANSSPTNDGSARNQVPAMEASAQQPSNDRTSGGMLTGNSNSNLDTSSGAFATSQHAVTDPAATEKLSETWSTVDVLISKSRFQDALILLSTFYEDDMLTNDEQSNLQAWLDALAAKVIYSMDPTLEMPHIVRQGETIEQIAASYQIPPTLLYNINRDRIDGDGFKPGTELKVVQGPFRAEVNLTRQRLTLWLDDMYAGSFPIRVGQEPAPETGMFRVADKTDQGRAYTGSSNTSIAEMAANNPYGKHLLDLGRGILIHGSPEGRSNASGQGCIALKEEHARDVFEILDRHSEVRIVR